MKSSERKSRTVPLSTVPVITRSAGRPAAPDQPRSDPGYILETEEQLIGACLGFSDAFGLVMGKIEPRHFFAPDLAEAWDIFTTMSMSGQKLDLFSFWAKAKELGRTERLRTFDYYSGLTYQITTVDSTETLAYFMLEAHAERALQAAAQDVYSIAYQSGPAHERFAEALGVVINAQTAVADTQDRRPKTIAELAPTVYDHLQKIAEQGQQVGLSTGISSVDDILVGLLPGDLVLLGARPGMGKTAFALALAKTFSEQAEFTLFFSGEMTKEQLMLRYASSAAGVDGKRLASGQLSDAEMSSLNYALGEALHNHHLVIDDQSKPTLSHVIATARVMAARHRLSAIIIDYVQLMHDPSRDWENRNTELTHISGSLKALAKDLRVPVIALAQLSRSLESRTDRRPLMSDLRESGALEQDADAVMFLYRDNYYNKQSAYGDVAEAIFAKVRRGSPGIAYLHFDGRFMQFRSADGFTPPGGAGRYQGGGF